MNVLKFGEDFFKYFYVSNIDSTEEDLLPFDFIEVHMGVYNR